jgi:hypothetical protein
MKRTVIAATATLLLSGLAVAATPATPDEPHPAHHAQQAAANEEEAAKFDQQLNVMRDMHAKMLAAKTPEARAALMGEHMKAMHNGVAMMGSMESKGEKGMREGKGKGGHRDMLARRMDMMEMTMQMMVDRESMKPPAAR